jgi:hypothetical protein
MEADGCEVLFWAEDSRDPKVAPIVTFVKETEGITVILQGYASATEDVQFTPVV